MISEGIPPLQKHATDSGGSVPSENEHLPCKRRHFPNFFSYQVPESVLQCPSRLWGSVTVDRKDLYYATESTIVRYVTIFLEDIIKAMRLSFQIESHLGIKHITPDVCVLTYGTRLVGVVEVKKPSENILTRPTVLGELFDQLMLVEGFYMSGPVIGILTTLEEWMFCWFPVDDNSFASENLACEFDNSAYFTPKKPDQVDRTSPPGSTPSQTQCRKHGLKHEDELKSNTNEFVLERSFIRTLSTTKVFNIYKNYEITLQYIYTALLRMTQVKINHEKGIPQCVFKLHKNERKITWHPASDVPFSLKNLPSSPKFPRSKTTKLLAVEDLGRGSSGKAWLAYTLSNDPAMCVLKFSNDPAGRDLLNAEKKWWDIIYPEFSKMTKVEFWSGSYALLMPHFCSIPEGQRNLYRNEIKKVLANKFHKKGLYHDDVKWRNIGCYITNSGKTTIVLYDLHRIRKYSRSESLQWVDNAMNYLFPLGHSQASTLVHRHRISTTPMENNEISYLEEFEEGGEPEKG